MFVTSPHGILGQVWNLIGSIPDFCLLPYFVTSNMQIKSDKINTKEVIVCASVSNFHGSPILWSDQLIMFLFSTSSDGFTN